MVMTKTKSLTISVVVLSILLSVALTATIILAAFSFTAKASTTFTFAGGVTIKATNGLTSAGVWKANLVTTSGGISTELSSANNTNITQGIALAPIKIQNTSAKEIKIAVAVVISGTSEPSLYVGSTTAVGTTALKDSVETASNNFGAGTPTYISAKINNAGSALQWATFTLAKDASAFITNYINTGYTESLVNGLAGANFTATLYLAGVYSNQELTTAIQSANITSTSWTVA